MFGAPDPLSWAGPLVTMSTVPGSGWDADGSAPASAAEALPVRGAGVHAAGFLGRQLLQLGALGRQLRAEGGDLGVDLGGAPGECHASPLQLGAPVGRGRALLGGLRQAG